MQKCPTTCKWFIFDEIRLKIKSAYPGCSSLKHLGVFLLALDGLLVHHRVFPFEISLTRTWQQLDYNHCPQSSRPDFFSFEKLRMIQSRMAGLKFVLLSCEKMSLYIYWIKFDLCSWSGFHLSVESNIVCISCTFLSLWLACLGFLTIHATVGEGGLPRLMKRLGMLVKKFI